MQKQTYFTIFSRIKPCAVLNSWYFHWIKTILTECNVSFLIFTLLLNFIPRKNMAANIRERIPFWWLMDSHSKDNNSNTTLCHRNWAINKFFHLSIDLQEITLSVYLYPSSAVSPPLPLQTVYRLHLRFHYTALFSIAELKLCLAVCHHSALLPKQPDSVNRLLLLILCALSVVRLSCYGSLLTWEIPGSYQRYWISKKKCK